MGLLAAVQQRRALLLSCCLTSTEARWPIRDGDRVGRGRESERLDRGNRRKRPERPWTAARTMEVLRRCPLAIAQRLVHCAIALSTAVLDRVTKTMSVAPLLTNNLDNSKQKTSNLLSPAPPPYSWSLLGIVEGPAPPPSSKISRSFDLAWNPRRVHGHCTFYLRAAVQRRGQRLPSGSGTNHTPSIAFRHPPPRKDVVNQCLEFARQTLTQGGHGIASILN